MDAGHLYAVRPATIADFPAMVALVHRVFLESVAPYQSEAGIACFIAQITPEALAEHAVNGQASWLAFADGVAIGALHRRGGDHLSLLFVDPPWQRRGVGRALIANAERDAPLRTVNASLNAIGAYERYGFAALGPARERDHIRYVPMKRTADVTPTVDLAPYLAADAEIDFDHPNVAALARDLRHATQPETARACFDWVRDSIPHCIDAAREEVPCAASETLAAGTGFCYAKSHLLVALLRANGIAAGLGYQRLTWDGPHPPYCLHGFAVVWLDGHGWYRCDPRGNSKPGVDCHFTPGVEHLAYPIVYPGECTSPQIHARPLPELVAFLRQCASVTQYRQRPIDLDVC
ncbi:GNAT family N-acetyltransferase [Chitiniphilus eburneus]|nr:GNAT family N-acetyltransferase [Chitiniphilus eburneus]